MNELGDAETGRTGLVHVRRDDLASDHDQSSGEMALRWTAAGMLEAERQFRKIIGYRDLATLVTAIEMRA